MIDESINISITSYLIVFAIFVEDGEAMCVFLGLFGIKDGKKDVALRFETLLMSLKEWGLDVSKYVPFGSDALVEKHVEINIL